MPVSGPQPVALFGRYLPAQNRRSSSRPVCRLQDLHTQLLAVGGMSVQEITDDSDCLAAIMVPPAGLQPGHGEKNVAGALDLLEEVQRWS